MLHKIVLPFFVVALVLFIDGSQCFASNQMLKGRIEEIFGSGQVKLPPTLKALIPTLDKREQIRPPRVLDPRLKSLPATLRGEWKGKIKVVEVEFNDSYARNLPEDADVDRTLFTVGREANARFRFYTPTAGVVKMDPPAIYFYVDPYELEKYFGRKKTQVFLETGWVKKQAYSNSLTSVLDEKPIENVVRILSPNGAEQCTLSDCLHTHRRTNKKVRFFAEHVFELKKNQAFQLDVRVAEVVYGADGQWWKKILFEGQLK